MPRLSLCMIVKNEAHVIEACLRSVQGIVDEMILVDTGSSDGTVEIAKSFGARISTFAWCDDFSAARNASLDLATGDWVLVLDADEVLSTRDAARVQTIVRLDHGELFEIIQTTYTNTPEATEFTANALPDQEAAGFLGYIESPLVRLFRKRPQHRFTGIIHEHVRDVETQHPITKTDIRIHHYGKVVSSSDRIATKRSLYLSLNEKMAVQDGTYKSFVELGVQAWDCGLPDKALDALARASLIDSTMFRPYAISAAICLNFGRYREAIAFSEKALQRNESDVATATVLSSALIESGQIKQALRLLIDWTRRYPRSVPLLNNLGAAYLRERNIERARFALSQALREGGEQETTLINLTLAALGANDLTEAKRWGMLLYERYPNSTRAQAAWAAHPNGGQITNIITRKENP